MDLLKANFWGVGILRQAKFLFSSPQMSQANYLIREAGTITRELFPVHTGFQTFEDAKKSWFLIHTLKFDVWKNGQPIEGEQVLLLNERSFLPDDPEHRISDEDKEKLCSLKDIAILKDAQSRHDALKSSADSVDITHTIIIWGCVIIVLELILLFWKAQSRG
jgi:hypothetical protein